MGKSKPPGFLTCVFPTFPSGVSLGRLLNLHEPKRLPPGSANKYLLPRGCLGWGCPRPGEGRPSSPALQSTAEGHVRRVKGGPTGLLGWACWEGGLSGPEGGGRRVWSGIWRVEPTRVIYAPSLGRELRGTAMQTTKGRFSWRPPAQPRLPKKQSRPVTATSKVPRPFPTP